MKSLLKSIYFLSLIVLDRDSIAYRVLFSSIRILWRDKVFLEIYFDNILSIKKEKPEDLISPFSLNCKNFIFSRGLIIELATPYLVFTKIVISPKDEESYENILSNLK